MANLRGLVVPIGGDPSGLLRALTKSERAAQQFSREVTRTGLSAQRSAQLQVSAAVKTEARLRSEIAEYKRLGATAARGSREQVAAARLAAQAQARLARSTAVSARESRQLAAAAARTERGFSRVGRGAIAGSGALRSFGRSIAFASGAYLGSAGLVFGIKSAIQASSEFDNTLQKIIGLAGGSEKQVKAFRQQLIGLGPAVGKSPQELAEALYFVASSGVEASRQMGVVRVSAMAAAAGLGETQTVADAVTSAMNAYGAANLSARQATDVLVATVREGKGEASAFAPVIGNVAALASQLGVSFNEVGAALAAQTRLGVDAQTASVQLQQVFSNLVKVSPSAEKAFRSVGLTSKGLREELREKGLLAVLRTLQERFGGNTVAMSKAFPNIRALRGLLALIGKQAGSTQQIFGRMKDSTGALSTAFGAVSKDADFQFARFNAAIKATQIQLGAALAPAAAKAAAAIAGWLSKTENQRRLQNDVNQVLRTAGRVIRGLIVALRLAKTVLTPFVNALGGVERTATIAGLAMLTLKARSVALGLGLRRASVNALTLRSRLAALGRLGTIGITVAVAYEVTKGAQRFSKFLGGTGVGKKLGLGDTPDKDIIGQVRAMVAGGDPAQSLAALEQLQASSFPFSKASRAEINKGIQTLRSRLAAGTNTADRAPGRSRAGAGAFATQQEQAAAERRTTTRRVRSHAVNQIAIAQEQLAKAELTATQADNRAALTRLAALTRQKITKTRDLKERTQLYQELGGYESQIAQLDKDAAEKQKAARDKQLSALKERESTLRQRIRDITDQFKGAVDTAREGIGELFSGPVLNPVEDQAKRILGVRRGGPDVGTLTADLRAQTAQFAAFQRNLNLLRRRGAPEQLIRELSAQGISGAANVAALAQAKPGQLREFFKAFSSRERLAIRTARATMRAQLVNLHAARVQLHQVRAQEGRVRRGDTIHVKSELHVDGKKMAENTTTHQQRRRQSTATQRRGPSAGRTHA